MKTVFKFDVIETEQNPRTVKSEIFRRVSEPDNKGFFLAYAVSIKNAHFGQLLTFNIDEVRT